MVPGCDKTCFANPIDKSDIEKETVASSLRLKFVEYFYVCTCFTRFSRIYTFLRVYIYVASMQNVKKHEGRVLFLIKL